MGTTNWNLYLFIQQVFLEGSRFIFWPISIFRSVQIFLIIQSSFLGFSAVIIYKISKLLIHNRLASLLLSASYLIYFPLAGVNWFDFHYQIFFIPVFLVAYYMELRSRLRISFILFIALGFIKFPYLIFTVIYSFSNLIFPDVKLKLYQQGISKKYFYTVLFIVSFSLFLIQYFYLELFAPTFITIHSTSIFNPLYNFKDKIITLLFIFGPFLFVPWLSRKWILLYFPYLYLLFFANNSSYYYPFTFQVWYASLYIPFVYLGTIDFLSKHLFEKDNKRKYSRVFKWRFRFNKHIKVMFALGTVLILLICSFFLEPYGPYNNQTFNNFNLGPETNVNLQSFIGASQLAMIIPNNASYVLLQNDIALFFPRPNINNILVSQYNIGPNISLADVANNSFPFNGGSSSGIIRINYVLADVNNLHSLTEPPYDPGYLPTYSMVQLLLNSGYYGIVGEEYGSILLERNFNGNIAPFYPFTNNYSSTLARIDNSSFSLLNSSSYSNSFPYGIRGTYLLPGSYDITASLSLERSISNGSFQMLVSFYNGANWTVVRTNAIKISKETATISVSLNLSNNNLMSMINYSLKISNMTNENMASYSLSILQLTP